MGQSAGVQEDLLGTKRLTTNASGTPIGTFASLPFGDGYTPTGTDPDPSHFALLDHDAESNTDHAQFRQYSPTSVTWMSPDPYDGSYNQLDPQSFNRYVYAGNNPLMYVDISGKDYTICNTPVGPGQTMPAGYQYTAATSGCFTYSDEDWYEQMRDGYGGGNTGPPQGMSGTVSAPDGEVWAMITYTNPDGSQGQDNPYQTPTPFAPNNGTNYDPNNSAPAKPTRDCGAEAKAAASVVPSPVPDGRSLIAGFITGLITYGLPEKYGGGSPTAAAVGFVVGAAWQSTQNFFESSFRFAGQMASCNYAMGNMGIPTQ